MTLSYTAGVARLNELEWLICHETDRSLRRQNITEYNAIYEAIHGRGSTHRGGQGDLSDVRTDH